MLPGPPLVRTTDCCLHVPQQRVQMVIQPLHRHSQQVFQPGDTCEIHAKYIRATQPGHDSDYTTNSINGTNACQNVS